MNDPQIFRANVGIIIMNDQHQLLLAKRAGLHDAWQFPQGGMRENETPKQAMYRELYEELGLTANDVEVIQESADWLTYHLPKQFIRHHQKPVVIGQKQKWFLLKIIHEQNICLSKSKKPEFDKWKWVDYWYPAEQVIEFKRDVYQKILQEFSKIIKNH